MSCSTSLMMSGCIMEIFVPLNTCSRIPVVLYLTSTLHKMEAMTHRQDPSTIKGIEVNQAPGEAFVSVLIR